MGERTQYTPGTFCWADVSTTDQEGAKAFYSALFGWEIEDLPVGDGMSYSMARLDGKSVAAISQQPEQQREAGVPPLWNNYVAVESADDTAQRAQELGATVHAPPFDVMDAGRMSVMQDPQGAFFMVWQARDMIGAHLVNGPGMLSWNELTTPDADAATPFYGGLFGWSFNDFEGSPQKYLVIMNKDRSNGGIVEMEQPGMPPNWIPYFGIDDIDSGVSKVEELGGRKLVGPTDIGVAKIAVVTDPQGAAFALYAGQFED